MALTRSLKHAGDTAPAPTREESVCSPVPAAPGVRWLKVAAEIAAEIEAGDLKDGEKLPAETMLARRFGVNRQTVRRAIGELARKGMLKTIPQVGSYVALFQVTFPVWPPTPLLAVIEAAGMRPSTRLVGHKVCTAPPEVAAELGVALRTQVVELEMVRLANDIPVAYCTFWLPHDRFFAVGKHFKALGSVRKAIERIGVKRWRRRSACVRSRRAEPMEAEQLGVAAGTMMLCVKVVDVDDSGEPVTAGIYRFVADRTRFVFAG